MNAGQKLPMLLLAALVWTPMGLADAATSDDPQQQSYADSWWTGPILAASPSALPRGHMLIEPYVYDVIVQGSYDDQGHRQSAAHTDNVRNLSYILYGLTDQWTFGLLPRFGYNAGANGTHGSGLQFGDLTLHTHYQLHKFREHHWPPALAFVIEETLPTGRYDRLGSHPGDGLGSGVHATTYSIYTQRYFWAPNGRIVRTRLDFSYSHSNSTALRDVSVYGTRSGFRGQATPGDSIVIDLAWEYSVTRNWVLALDLEYARNAGTHVRGLNDAASATPTSVNIDSGTSTTWSLAPAIEYNFNGNVGLLAGAKFTVAGSNAAALLIPVVAINWVR
jgi:hypothetical protein